MFGKAIALILNEFLGDPLDEIYGVYGFKKEAELFIYQFVIEQLNGPTLSLNTVDKICQKLLSAKKLSDWQMTLYKAHKYKYSKMVQKIEQPKYENLKKVKFKKEIHVGELNSSTRRSIRHENRNVFEESMTTSKTKLRSQSIDKSNYLRVSFSKKSTMQSQNELYKLKASLR